MFTVARNSERPGTQGALLLGSFEFFDMPFQLFQRCPARHVKAYHFEYPLRRRAAIVNQIQKAQDDRHVRLDLDAVLPGTQQMRSPEVHNLITDDTGLGPSSFTSPLRDFG